MVLSERDQQISPIVQESVIHNTKVGSTLLVSKSSFLIMPAPFPPAQVPPKTNRSSPTPQILSNTHNLTASLSGIGAGILGLEGYAGFAFYILLTLLTTTLIYALRVAPNMSPAKTIVGADAKKTAAGRQIGGMQTFFQSPLAFWTSGLVDGASGFVLTWTLFYGLVRA